MRIHIRRACYDKPWRCPGWAGGGWRYPKKTVCEGGSIGHYESKLANLFLPRRHADCGTVRLPLIVKWVDPTWVLYIAYRKIQDWKYWRSM